MVVFEDTDNDMSISKNESLRIFFSPKIVLNLFKQNVMKTLEKLIIGKSPKANIIIDSDKYAFLDGIEMFAEKNARAKEKLSKIKFPEGFSLR